METKHFISALIASATLFLIVGCHHDHYEDHHDYDQGGIVLYDSDHHYEHHGFYDDSHNWHGGYYDEQHQYHQDPQDWHDGH